MFIDPYAEIDWLLFDKLTKTEPNQITLPLSYLNQELRK